MLLFMRSRLEALGVSHSTVHAEPLIQQDAAMTAPLARGETADAAPGAGRTGSASNADACIFGARTAAPAAANTDCLEPGTDPTGTTAAKGVGDSETSSQPHGWTVTRPCAKGASIIQLDEVTLQQLPLAPGKQNAEF